MTWQKKSSSTSLSPASASSLGGIKVGSGLSIDSNGVLSATLTAGSGTTEHYKGLLSDFTGTAGVFDNNAYIKTTLESGIYRVLNSNLPPVMNPPFTGVDFILTHQKMFTDFNWAYQWIYPVDNPGKVYVRRVLCGSPYTDSRQGAWVFVGSQAQIDEARIKKVLTMGDSITAQWGGSVDYPTTAEQSFMSYVGGYQQQWIKRFPDMQIWSIAYGGAKMANYDAINNAQYNPHSFYYLANHFTNFASYDIVTVAYGTNDMGNSLPIGSGANETDINTVQGAMNNGIQAIYNANPNVQILFITPPLRADGVNGYTVQQCHDQIKLYSDAIVTVCEKWDIPYFYGLKQNGINMYNYPTYLDGGHLHPSSAGAELYGCRLAEWLRQYI